MIRAVMRALSGWAAEGQPAALATVVEVHGRAPLPAGACLAVAADGRTAGAVSGGCVEAEVVRAAQDVLAGGPARRLRFTPGGDELTGSALPCGGGIDVWVQRWCGDAEAGDGDARPAERADDVAAGPSREAFEQRVFAEAVRSERDATLPIRTRAWQGDELEKYLLAAPAPPRLVMVGAGIVAGALATQARALGWITTVIDPRTAIAAHAPISDARRLILDWPAEALRELDPLGPADALLALSHQPALDDAALRAALLSDVGFIGALGARRSHDERIMRLRASGCTERELGRIVGPVGLDLGTSEPAEVAVSIVAELIAARNGRAGGRLRDADGDRRIGAEDGAHHRLTALSALRGTRR